MRDDDAKPATPIAARAGLPLAVSLADGLALAAATPDGSPSSSSPRTPPSPASPWRGFTVGALQCGAPSDVASPGGAAGWAAAVEAAVADLAHSGTRAAALERLAGDPHAPTDVLECSAWPSLIAALPDALGDATCGDSAADFGERVVADAAAGDAGALADVLAASAAALSRHGAPPAARLALAAASTVPAAWAAADEGDLDRAAAGAAALLAPPARGAPPTPSPAAAALVDVGAATDWLAAWAATPRVAGRLFGALGRGALDAHATAVAAVGRAASARPPALALSVAAVGAALATAHGRRHLSDAGGAAVALATLACAPGPPCGVAEAARAAVTALARARARSRPARSTPSPPPCWTPAAMMPAWRALWPPSPCWPGRRPARTRCCVQGVVARGRRAARRHSPLPSRSPATPPPTQAWRAPWRPTRWARCTWPAPAASPPPAPRAWRPRW